MKIIGLDIGTKRIGVARASSATRIAVPVGFINVDGSEWQEIAKIASLNGTNWFVLGLPRSNEGNETKQSQYVRQFAQELIRQMPEAKIRFQDESLTSVEAENRLKARRHSYEKGEIDAEAAAIILQDFLESFNKNDLNTEVEVEKTDSIVRNGIENVKKVGKKEVDKVKMTAKKTKHKVKKWPFFVVFLMIVAAGGGFLLIQREKQRREYEKYVAFVESQTAEVFNFTIRPGETIFDIKDALVEQGYGAEEVEAALSDEYDFDFLKKRPEGASLEGYLYGETYEFYQTATAHEVIAKFLEGTQRVISENNLEARYAERGLSLHEGITLASVIQKESPAGEQATVAQVFLSRLAYGMPLGSDVTVSYALDVLNPERDRDHNDNAGALTVDSCYNTRKYAGLPCGPIASPGLAALTAVAEPSDTEYLYFLTGDDGLMYYSYTESEHNQNAAEHCQELCNFSL